MSGPALIVFAKAPRPGRVKTRLSPPLTPAQAARLYDAFLRDALDLYAQAAAGPGFTDPFGVGAPLAVRLYLDEPGAAPGLAPPSVSVHAQRGDGLGARLGRAFAETFAAGHTSAVVIGTDHPTLPPAFIGEAVRASSEPLAVAIGPSDDGGYYLLGTGELSPGLFDMAYSHATVFEDTVQAVLDAGLAPTLLPPHYDVDDADALRRLVAEWRAGADVGARTAEALARLQAAGAGV